MINLQHLILLNFLDLLSLLNLDLLLRQLDLLLRQLDLLLHQWDLLCLLVLLHLLVLLNFLDLLISGHQVFQKKLSYHLDLQA